MRNFILLSLFILVSGAVFASHIEESAVPAAVKAYVTKNYAQAKDIKWEYEKDKNYYEAEFHIQGMEHELVISPAGIVLRSEIDMLPASLPEVIRTYITDNYAGYTISEAEKVTKGERVRYKVRITGQNAEGHKRHKSILFNPDGTIIRRK